MGLFRKRDKAETALAKTLPRQDVSVTGTVAAMHETGETRRTPPVSTSSRAPSRCRRERASG